MGPLLGEDQNLVTFPGLRVADNIYVSANNETALNIFPVKPQKGRANSNAEFEIPVR